MIDIYSKASDLIHTVNSNQIISAIIWGGAGLFLYLMPYFYYLKRFYFQKDGEDSKSYFEVMATAFGLQIFAMAVLSTAAYFSNQMISSDTDFDAQQAIRLFYTGSTTGTTSTNENIKLWDTWMPSGDLSKDLATIAGDQSIVVGSAIIIYYTAIVLYFILLGVSMLTMAFPIFYVMRQSSNQDPSRYSYMQKIGIAVLLFIGLSIILYIHQAIASGYVATFGDISDFSFFKMMQAAWREIFLPQTR